MRTWRVGTFSMGAALLSLGIFLLASRFFKINLLSVMMAWWPVLLMILGVEILIYLYLNKKESSPIKYDFLSVIFVGLIGFTGISIALASTTGVIQKFENMITAEVKTIDLPVFQQNIDESIKRIVVETEYPLTIETTNEKNIMTFGTVQAYMNTNGLKNSDEYIQTYTNGDTLYATFKKLPFDSYHSSGDFKTTMLIPATLQLEVNGNYHDITIRARKLLSNWHVDRMSNVVIQASKNNNFIIDAKKVNYLNNDRINWVLDDEGESNQMEKSQDSNEEREKDNFNDVKKATYQIGDGKYNLVVSNSESISVEVEN